MSDALLERRYRAVLRLLPKSYRREREDEMVAAFLEAAGEAPDADDPRPGWGEVGSVLALAVRLRLGGQGASPRAFARGEAVRLVALLGLAFLAAISIATAVHQSPILFDDAALVVGAPRSADRLLFLLGAVECGCWIAAFLALVRGRQAAAKRAAVLALLPVIGSTAVRAGGQEPMPQAAAWLVLTVVPVVALLLAHHRDALPVTLPRRRALVPLAAGVLAGAAHLAVLAALHPAPWSSLYLWTDPVGLGVLALTAGAVVCVARRAPAPWRLALAMLSALLLTVRLMDMTDAYGQFLVMGLGQAALLTALATGLGITGRRALPAAV